MARPGVGYNVAGIALCQPNSKSQSVLAMARSESELLLSSKYLLISCFLWQFKLLSVLHCAWRVTLDHFWNVLFAIPIPGALREEICARISMSVHIFYTYFVIGLKPKNLGNSEKLVIEWGLICELLSRLATRQYVELGNWSDWPWFQWLVVIANISLVSFAKLHKLDNSNNTLMLIIAPLKSGCADSHIDLTGQIRIGVYDNRYSFISAISSPSHWNAWIVDRHFTRLKPLLKIEGREHTAAYKQPGNTVERAL